MRYMGSKSRIAKEILPIMLKNKTDNQCWVEPFVGGGNMIDKVKGGRIGSDVNKYAIQGLISIRDCIDSIPKNNTEFTEEDYKNLRTNDNYQHKGYAGFAFSYSGKWMGGWCRDGLGKRDYVAESYRNAVNQSLLIQGVEFLNCSYDELKIPTNSIIYCDPPYKNTTKYSHAFDYEKFYNWCREMKNQGHTIYISEYEMPNDFICLYSKQIVSSLTKDTGSKKGVEKLYTL